jgi:hypothetical protein
MGMGRRWKGKAGRTAAPSPAEKYTEVQAGQADDGQGGARLSSYRV